MRRGCGWLLITAGALAMLFAVLFAFGMWTADEAAGVKNDAEWDAYNQRMEQLDSIADTALRDSLITEMPAPMIRQGGFATIFGILIGLVIIIIAAFPLAIGCILLVKYRRNEKYDYQRDEN